MRGHPRHDSYYSKQNRRVPAEGCGAERLAPHLGGHSSEKRSRTVRDGMEDRPARLGEVGYHGRVPGSRLGSFLGRRSGMQLRWLNVNAVYVLQAMAGEASEVRGGSSDSEGRTDSGRCLGDGRVREAPRSTALRTEDSGPKWKGIEQCRRTLEELAMEEAYMQRSGANGIRNGGRLALTATIDSRAKAERRNCMAGPKRCEKSQCRRTIKKLGIAILQHRTVQGQRWANAMVAGERWSRHTLYTPHYTHPPHTPHTLHTAS